MSIVSFTPAPSTVVPCLAIEPCSTCGEPTIADTSLPEPARCEACRRMSADMDLRDLFRIAKALRSGEPPFDVLSAEERAEQLQQLICPDDPATPPARIPVASFDGAPNPIERQRIELEDEQFHRELTQEREQRPDPAHIDAIEFLGRDRLPRVA